MSNSDMVRDALDSYAEFYDRVVVALGFSKETLPSTELDEMMIGKITQLQGVINKQKETLESFCSICGVYDDEYEDAIKVVESLNQVEKQNAALRELVGELMIHEERLHRSLCAYLDYAPANLAESCYDPNGSILEHRALIQKAQEVIGE